MTFRIFKKISSFIAFMMIFTSSLMVYKSKSINEDLKMIEVLPTTYFSSLKNDSLNFKKTPDTLSAIYFIEKFGIEFSKQEDSFLIFPPENVCFWSNKALKPDSLCFKTSWRSSYLKHSNHALGKSNSKYPSGGYVLKYENKNYSNYYFSISIQLRDEEEDPYSQYVKEYFFKLTHIIQ